MKQMLRRRVLGGTVVLLSTVLSGCLSEMVSLNKYSDEELRNRWERFDDYPDDEFRNLKMEAVSRAYNTSLGSTLVSTDTFVVTYYGADLDVDSIYVDVSFSADTAFDVWVVDNVSSNSFELNKHNKEMMKDIDLFDDPKPITSYNPIDEYSAYGVKEYSQVIEQSLADFKSDGWYSIILTLANTPLPETTAQQEAFNENNDITINSQITHSYYVPFEKYKHAENKELRKAYDGTGKYAADNPTSNNDTNTSSYSNTPPHAALSYKRHNETQ